MLKTINKKFHTPVWLSILLIAVILLRLPSLFMPYSYGDEMIYLTLGQGIRHGVTLYSGIYDNKPPLLYIIAAIAGNLFLFKSILMIWNLLTIYFFWRLSETLLPKKDKLQIAATVVFAVLTSLPLLEGNVANAELFMLLPTIGAFLILFRSKKTNLNTFWAGVLFSLAALFKIPAAFEAPVIVVYWLITAGLKPKNIKNTVRKTFYLILGFIIPLGLSFVYFWFKGSFADYLSAAFLQNFGYLSSWRPQDNSLPFYQKNAPLLIRSAIVLVGSFILFWRRKKLDKVFIFVTLWLLFTLFAVTLSERPYPHYLIQAVPAVSFLFAYLIFANNNLQFVSLIPLALAMLVPIYFNYWYYPVTPYYEKFINLTSRKISKNEYLLSFSSETPRNYKIADYISKSTLPEDKIFVWGDDAKIYALSRRLPPTKYVADYHIVDHHAQSKVLTSLIRNPPKTIIVLPESQKFLGLDSFLNEKYLETINIDNAVVWRLSMVE